MVLTLKNGAVWAPGHLKKRVIEKNICPPFYIRPQGMKPCKNNPANKYYAYDLVVKKKQMLLSYNQSTNQPITCRLISFQY